jgi:hypothetical protein
MPYLRGTSNALQLAGTTFEMVRHVADKEAVDVAVIGAGPVASYAFGGE